jgi:hypothetical protein
MCACFLCKDERTVQDLLALHSEALLWSAAGSGVISLSDLEAELRGSRTWDREGWSDEEFIRACHRHGIKVFGVVFTAQGYEVSVELNQDESEFISFGRKTGAGKSGFWGLREFYKDLYPRIHKSFRSYHTPERLAFLEKELAGRDFLEGTACQDLQGNKSICYWVTSTGLAHDYEYTNYFMCKNSPLWREHLKAIVEMQIDAGLDGVQFDEPGSSFEVAGSRAGFCPYCQARFREYLVERYGERFKDFDYRELLQKKGAGVFSELAYFKGMPYWQDWKRSLLVDAKRNFSELVNHARTYARNQNRDILCAANFFNWMPHYLVLAQFVDVFSLEYDPGIPPARTNLIYPEIARALDPEKPVTMVPDIAFATHLRKRANDKKDVNLLRYLIAEAAFAGSDFMVPYSCLCVTGSGAYFPPVNEISGYLAFVKEHREKFQKANHLRQACVILSFPSYFWSFDFLRYPGKHFASLEAVTQFLHALQIQYRLVIWGDGEFIKDSEELKRDELVILAQVSHLTDEQVYRVREFIEKGGRVLILGKCGIRDSLNQKRTRLPFSALKPGANNIGTGTLFLSPEDLVLKYKAASRPGKDMIIGKWLSEMNLQPEIIVHNRTGLPPLVRAAESEGKLLIQILNPNYNYMSDAFQMIENAELVLGKDLTGRPGSFLMHTPEGEIKEINGEVKGQETRFSVPEFRIYALLEETA